MLRLRQKYGAFRLLVYLLDGSLGDLVVVTRRMHSTYAHIRSFRALGRRLGTGSRQVKDWLGWLEWAGYLRDIRPDLNRRGCRLVLRSLRLSPVYLSRETQGDLCIMGKTEPINSIDRNDGG